MIAPDNLRKKIELYPVSIECPVHDNPVSVSIRKLIKPFCRATNFSAKDGFDQTQVKRRQSVRGREGGRSRMLLLRHPHLP